MKQIPGSLYAQILALEVQRNQDRPGLVFVPDSISFWLNEFITQAWLVGIITTIEEENYLKLLEGYYDHSIDSPI